MHKRLAGLHMHVLNHYLYTRLNLCDYIASQGTYTLEAVIQDENAQELACFKLEDSKNDM